MRTLTHEEAQRVYDRIGAKQDTQAFYEDAATRELVRHGDFGSASAVYEFGCGTGRFARNLLDGDLPDTATYRAVDSSSTMVELSKERLSGFGDRVEVVLTGGAPPHDEPSASYDRFVSNYVLDLLSESDIEAVLTEAHRMLRPGGLLCLASLSPGHGLVSRLVIGAFSFIHRRSPGLVGGCRPIELMSFLPGEQWKVRHHAAFSPFGIPSEVVVAERLPSS